MFIKALMTHEAHLVREASRVLSEGAAKATEEQKLCQKQTHQSSARVYPSGSEFTICYEATQIMRAILGVMNVSISETLMGFYSVRRAYATFRGLAELPVSSVTADAASEKTVATAVSSRSQSIHTARASSRTTSLNSNTDQNLNAEAASKPVDSRQTESRPTSDIGAGLRQASGIDAIADPIDRFVYTSSHVGYGVLLLGISLIPPIFNTLLKIVGFSGDRDRGLQHLWCGGEASDGYGSIGALILFEYYSALGSTCEILTDELYPRPRLQSLLESMRTRFPDGRLWLIYEAQMAARDRDLDKAVRCVAKDQSSDLQQMKSLQYYVHSVFCMFMHRYEECRQSFEECIKLNERSHALSYFVAGAATVALYRKTKSPEEKAEYARDAERLFRLAFGSAGQKRFLAKRIPFEVFIARKVRKWEQRAKERNIDFIDAVGISPIDEMIYLWNGYGRLEPAHLEQSLTNLEWSENQGDKELQDEDIDERTVHTFLRAVILRNLGRRDEAKELLRQTISMDHRLIQGGNKDEWTCPLAHYE